MVEIYLLNLSNKIQAKFKFFTSIRFIMIYFDLMIKFDNFYLITFIIHDILMDFLFFYEFQD